MENLALVPLGDLKSLVKELRKFKDIRLRLGKRGIKLFLNMKENKKDYTVEYASGLDLEYVKSRALEVYSAVFHEKVLMENIEFLEVASLVGGMKVYAWDYAIDLSFSSIEKQLRK